MSHVPQGDTSSTGIDPGGDSPGGAQAFSPVGFATVVEASDAAGNTSTSYSLGVGQSARGQITSSSDSDWYQVTLTAGQTYTFGLVGTGLSTTHLHDPLLTLRNSAGTTLASDDDGGPGNNSSITFTASATGTYYLDVQSWINVGQTNAGQYTLSVAAGGRASYDVDMGAGALLRPDLSWSTPGTAATVTYGFRQSAASYTATGSNIATFTPVSAAEMSAINTIMQFWSSVCNVTFTPVNPGGYTDSATILFGNYNDPNDGAGAFAYYPGSTASTSPAGDVWINLQSVSTSSLPFGSYSFFALMHEVGHALGLAHPGDYNAAPGVQITYNSNAQFTQDSQQYTVMSYFDEVNTGVNYGGYAETPMLLDIYALQMLYGANTTARASNTIYGFGSNAGSVYDFSSNPNPAVCIWDAGGTDTLNCSGFTMAQTIDLNPGSYSSIGGLTGNVSIAFGAIIENAVGGSGNDIITGNSAANAISGNAGTDTINGGSGLDMLAGGQNSDRFVFDAAALADARAVSPVIDHVLDYNQGNSGIFNFSEGDVIDLTALLSQAYTGGQSVSALVRAVGTSGNAFANLQIDTDGAGGGATWTTIAQLDSLHPGNSLSVLLSGSTPVTVTVAAPVPQFLPDDFNGDGCSDAMFRNNTSGAWNYFDIHNNASNDLGTTMPGYAVVGKGNFNGDSYADALLRNNSTGDYGYYDVHNSTWHGIGPSTTSYNVVGVGDFNGDGLSDALFRNNSTGDWGYVDGNSHIWHGAGASTPSYNIVATGDFNHDGLSDALFRNNSTGDWGYVDSSSNAWHGLGASTPSYSIVGAGDFNHDGYADALFRNNSTGDWGYVDAYAGTWNAVPGGSTPSYNIGGVGDYNQDGYADALFRNNATGDWGYFDVHGVAWHGLGTSSTSLLLV